MKKNFFYATALVLGLAFTATACSDDDDNSTVNPADIEYNSENAASWHNYMRNVAVSYTHLLWQRHRPRPQYHNRVRDR